MVVAAGGGNGHLLGGLAAKYQALGPLVGYIYIYINQHHNRLMQ